MKVLQINAVYGYRSTGLIARDINDLLAKEGAEVFAAYQTCNEPPANGYRIGNLLDWKLHALLSRISGKQAWFSKGATKRFLQWVDQIRPDIVHLHNLHSNYIDLPLLLEYLAKKDIATVITMHDCWYFTGKCFHYANVGCDRFQTGCGNCPQKKTMPRSFFFDRSAEVFAEKKKLLQAIPRLKIVGCSEWICRESKKGFFKDFDVSCIRNGVDTDIFKPQDVSDLRGQYELGNAKIILGMANKWLLPSNGEALARVLTLLNENLRLVLIGCSESQIRKLKKASAFVLPLGYIKGREALARHYCLADVFVNLTHADTLPTVNMESICCGTPVVTYNSCGSPELVLEGCGMVVPEYDIDALIPAIQASLGKSTNVELARLTFEKTQNYRAYLDVYKKLI